VKNIGLVIDQATPHGRKIFDGIVAAIDDRRPINLIELPYHLNGRPPLKSDLDNFDALIVYTDEKHTWIPKLAKKGVRIVSCGGDWMGHEGVVSIGTKLGPILDLVVEHFDQLAFKHIAFFGYKVLSDVHRATLVASLKKVASPRDLEVHAVEINGSQDPEADIRRHLVGHHDKKLLTDFNALPTPIGIFCENDHYARLACQIASAIGKVVPSDIAVLGGGDEYISRFGSPTLSSISYPGHEIGRLAASLLDQVNPPMKNPVDVTSKHLVIRESTGGLSFDVQMERVHRWIGRHLLTNPTMNELAEVGGCTVKTLRQKYQKLYGLDPLTDIRQRRLKEIKRLLGETNLQLADIASKCGFSSQAAFYNYIMRHCGTPPSKIREEIQSTIHPSES
jgi:LacI family transcriptional regulator